MKALKKIIKSDDEFKWKQISKKSNEKEPAKKPTKVDAKEFNELIIKKEKDIDKKIFKNCFDFQTPSALLKNLYNLNDEIEKIEIGRPDKMVEIVEKILEFDKQQQQGKGLK